MAASSLISASIGIVATRRLPLPGHVPTGRMTAVMWNRKNGNVVRRLVGYERYATKASFECLGKAYELVRLYINFFQPTMKLVSKTRQGAKVRKVYDTAQTPYQRLMQSSVLTEGNKADLAAAYHGLNPVKLLKQINDNLEQLWRMAGRQTSVTGIMKQQTGLR